MNDVRFGFVAGTQLPNLFDTYLEWAQEAERLGADLLSFGEVPVVTPDPYLLLQSVAAKTTRPILGPVVSMPGLRHPAVHARTLVTFQELTGGRAFLGLGRGAGGLEFLGEPRARKADFVEYIRAVRALCAGERVLYRGQELQLTYEPRPVPVLVSAYLARAAYEGAGRYADGVIVGNGVTAERVTIARELTRAAAESEGRSFDELDMWYTLRVHVAESEEQGIEELAFYLSRCLRIEPTGEAAVPSMDDDTRERVGAYRAAATTGLAAYSFDPKANLELLDRYGLRTWGAKHWMITGTIDEIVPRVQALVEAGARNFIVPLMLPDIIKSTREVGEIFARLRSAV